MDYTSGFLKYKTRMKPEPEELFKKESACHYCNSDRHFLLDMRRTLNTRFLSLYRQAQSMFLHWWTH